MKITVKFFASFREQFQKDTVYFNPEDKTVTTGQLWQSITGESVPESALVAINHTYASFDDTVSAGDEVGFFPPVTGG